MGSKRQSTESTVPQKDPVAVELGRQGGLVGGKARAAALSPEERRRIASLAAKARWQAKSAKSTPEQRKDTSLRHVTYLLLKEEGLSDKQIARQLGISAHRLREMRQELNVMAEYLEKRIRSQEAEKSRDAAVNAHAGSSIHA